MINEKLNQVKKFYRTHKRLPSYSEMLELFGLSSKGSIYKIVNKWVEEGLLLKDNDKLSPTAIFFSIPMLGPIKAGFPTTQDSVYNEELIIDDYLLSNPGYMYALTVSGDSMIEAGINHGDLVILDKKREPKVKDIIAACVDNEWTLKYLAEDNGKVCLLPANPKYSPIYPKENLTIGGVVVKVIRSYY